MKRNEILAMNTIRTLSVDAIQQANSGHPGMPLGSAPMAFTLWTKHLNHTHKDSKWINRDRFILSAGHASALLYSLLHLFNYEVTLEDLKSFRQLDSKTPGHPEYGHTHGVEATTGPLGAGLATGVGMAMAQKHMASKYNKPNYPVFDNYTYVLVGDGCMMEGITSEASSLAGTLKLDRLIVLYDSNNITIEGSTDIAFNESVRTRYESYGFETFLVEDGNDMEELDRVINKAKMNSQKPSFIEVKTQIGYGSLQEGSASAHGAPLGKESIDKLKQKLNYPSLEPFFVAKETYAFYEEICSQQEEVYRNWQEMYKKYTEEFPILAQELNQDYKPIDINQMLEIKELLEFDSASVSTRVASGIVLNKLKDLYPNIIGGSADLAPSNMTHLKEESSFSRDNGIGRNIHFGVRELAMAAIGNGMMLYGGLRIYVSTFFVFSDYLKPMARLSALMNIPLTYVLTHDSIGVGEDGPTHEPIEQLAMFRSLPNFNTFRPADAKETAYGWMLAISSQTTPTALVLSRQNLPVLEGTGKDCLKGGYVVYGARHEDVIIIATGSEVSLAITVAEQLNTQLIKARVISMPSVEIFEQQTIEYKNSILPISIRNRVVLEAASEGNWGKYIGLDGLSITINEFGASGKAEDLWNRYGFTSQKVLERIENYYKKQ